MDLQTLIQTIVPLDQPAMDAALRRQAELAKPPGSLGRLESLSVQIAGITGKLDNQIHDNALLVFAADNGVVAEGVSIDAGILGYHMYKNGQQFHGGDGIVTKGIEATLQNVGRLGKDGMKETNEEIIRIMLGDC